MADLLDLAGAVGHQGCNDHRCTGAQVGSAERSGRKLLHALEHGHLTVHLDIRAHLAQLVHITEAVVPHALGDGGSPLCHAEQNAHQGLHIGGEARVGHGVDLEGQDVAGAANPHGIVKLLHLNARTAELCGDRLEVLGGDVLHQHIAAGGRCSHHVAAGLDLVGDDAVGAAVHLLDAAHLDDIGACAAHISAAHIQEVGQIDHMGLLGTVFQNGLTLGHDSGEHTVHGSTHAHLIKEDMSAVQLVGVDGDHAVVHTVLCAQSAEHLQVLVDGAGAEVAAAGHGHLGLAEAGQQCAEEIVAGTHLAGQVVGDVGAGQMGGVDLVGVLVQHPDLCAQHAEDLEAHRHIADVRQVLDDADVRCQNGSGQDAHSRIFRAGDDDFAVQGLTARNNKLFQFYDLLVTGPLPAGPKGQFKVRYSFSLYKAHNQLTQLQLLYYTQLPAKSKAPMHARRLFSVLPSFFSIILGFCLLFSGKFYICR